MQGLHLEQDGPIATITLDRPPVNAVDVPMMRALIDALRRVDASDTVRVALITGAGRCFSAGVDLRAQLAALEGDAKGPTDWGVAMYEALLNGRKPLIAAINGHALGAGLGIAASCNILLAAEDAEFGLPEIDVGALGGARHAMRLLGHSTVNRMLLTGHRLSARELARRGAIEAAVPLAQLRDRAMEIAREIASKDPAAIALARRCLSTVETMTVLDGYAFEARLGAELGRTPGAQASMRAFLERGRGRKERDVAGDAA